MAHGHYYEKVDQTVTPYDPKHMYLDGIRYALHGGTGWWRDRRRDPALFFQHGTRARDIYIKWRKFKCKYFGR